LADPSFKLEEPFARFRKGLYTAPFHRRRRRSVRGSRRGEMIARCVVGKRHRSEFRHPRLPAKSRYIEGSRRPHRRLTNTATYKPYDHPACQDEPDIRFGGSWLAVMDLMLKRSEGEDA